MGIFNIYPTTLSIPLIVSCKTYFTGEVKSSSSIQFIPIWYTEIE
jgi:hypothetical protein